MEVPLIVPGDATFAADLAPRLRPADAAELAANGREPLEGLTRCVGLSALSFAIVEPAGRPLALYGFAPLQSDDGFAWAAPWLLAAPDLTSRHRGWFLRATPQIVASGDHRWSRFWNRVDARNTLHVRWLRWAGFVVEPTAPHGPHGLPFHAFHRITQPCATLPPPL